MGNTGPKELPVWNGGDMHIELNQTNFLLGDYITGIIHVDQRRIFHTKTLTLCLKGEEHSFFITESDDNIY